MSLCRTPPSLKLVSGAPGGVTSDGGHSRGFYARGSYTTVIEKILIALPTFIPDAK